MQWGGYEAFAIPRTSNNRWGNIYFERKVASLLILASPTDVTAARHIIGVASYYIKFIENLSDMVTPLTDFTKKNTPFS